VSSLSARDVEHIFETLSKGDVPTRNCDAFAAGVEAPRAELGRQLSLAADGEGTIKFLRGGYGCGKTFMARLAVEDAQARGFATSFVVVSDNDLRFHRFDEVYRKVVTELATATCLRGALGDILDRWIAAVEAELMQAGLDPDGPDFDARVASELSAKLVALTNGHAPHDFIRAVQGVFTLKQRGEYSDAGSLLSWLSGSGNVNAAAKRVAGIKGDIESTSALDYLRGVVQIVHAAGYQGLLIVIDEAETILRMRTDSRHKSLNGIRQILDAAGSFPRTMWLFTGTPEFYDLPRGVAGLEPLRERISFQEINGFASLRQPQLRLQRFDRARLLQVARRLRELFPTPDRVRLETEVSDAWLEQLADEFTRGFRGDVGVVPRQFLRRLVTVMALVRDEPAFRAADSLEFRPAELLPPDRAHLDGVPPPAPDDAPVPVLDNW
jgi:hypothetical protein